jgi:rod shape-determining protein MreB and related proteins
MAFLLFAVIASAIGITTVLIRNRRPNSMEHSIEEFERGLRALAPEPSSRRRRPAE